MTQLQLTTAWFGNRFLDLRGRVRGSDAERGDVPGWVMITVMSAGLVVVIFGVFKSRITGAINDAIDSVTGGTK
ncbi:MAG TPA: hypothetical protein VHO01_05450 [Jatrophihabitans sp.]|nr:hypothetical protein [Jatrophihabitans sp.]